LRYWLIALVGLVLSCAPGRGSPEKAVRIYVARERGVAESDVAAICSCAIVFHLALQCDCRAQAHGIEHGYACECPDGRGRLPWVPAPCVCSPEVDPAPPVGEVDGGATEGR
jgi:hypothetical protein